MWIKLSPEEIAKVKVRQQRRRVISACALAGFSLLFFTFTHGRGWSRRQHSSWLVSSEEIPGRVVFAVPASIVIGLIGYWFGIGRVRPTQICRKCDIAKDADSVTVCSKCGRDFEQSETLKWKDSKHDA